MENSVANKTNVQVKEVEIRDHAHVAGYECVENAVIELQSDPMDIYLFCVRHGHVQLHASFIPHPLELGSGEAIFLAYPKNAWQVKLLTKESTSFFMMRISVSTLHKMINPSFDEHQLEPSNRMNIKDLMRLIPIGPSMMNCFEQLLYHKLRPPFNALFERAKFLEIFSQLMESSFGKPMDACPVTMSPAIEIKLSKVRRHIIEHVEESPDPDHLAVLFELPRNTLREGYRFVYGQTIHQFHSDYKLESAMQMLNSGEYLVKEVAFKIGYQNPSHFITAFKKKFGHTPKQYFKQEVIV
ncbi:MAG TPA: AraC family transcriptional regulator [Saprospiraceae bacterium]|nr:AraC family transcriptional regulator [Saprospiraceae bacterium]